MTPSHRSSGEVSELWLGIRKEAAGVRNACSSGFYIDLYVFEAGPEKKRLMCLC